MQKVLRKRRPIMSIMHRYGLEYKKSPSVRTNGDWWLMVGKWGQLADEVIM